jgi:hypothetical protein
MQPVYQAPTSNPFVPTVWWFGDMLRELLVVVLWSRSEFMAQSLQLFLNSSNKDKRIPATKMRMSNLCLSFVSTQPDSFKQQNRQTGAHTGKNLHTVMTAIHLKSRVLFAFLVVVTRDVSK